MLPAERWRAGCLVVLWVCLVGFAMSNTPNHKILVLEAEFNHSQPTTVNNTPTIELGSGNFTVTFTLTLNPAFTDLQTTMKVRLIPPYYNTVTRGSCKQYANGTGCASATYDQESYVDMATLSRETTVTISPGVVVQRNVNTTTAHYIEFDFGSVQVGSNPIGNKFITFEMTTSLSSFAQNQARVSTFDFQAELTVVEQNPTKTLTNTSALTFILVRPLLRHHFTASPAILESGVTSTITVTIQHTYDSTATAKNLTVKMEMTNLNTAAYEPYVTWSLNGGAETNSTSLSPDLLGGTQTDFPQNSVLVITFTRTAPVIPELETSAGAEVTLTYSADVADGSPMTYTDVYRAEADTPSISLTSRPGTDKDLPSTLPAGSSQQIIVTFNLPRGSLALSFVAYFTGTGEIPMSGESSTVTTNFPITYSDNTKINVGSSSFMSVSSRRRRKRSTALTLTRNVGTLTNTQTSLATVTLTVTLAVGDVSTGSSLTTVDTYMTLNGKIVYLTSSAGSINRPILTLSKTAQIDDANYTPDRMKFSLLAAHDASSNGPAYDVSLSGGNDYFDIYWRTDFVGPALSQLVITDDRKFKWTESVLNQASGTTQMSMSYKADASTNQDNLPLGMSWLNASLTYKSGASATTLYEAIGACCITVTNTEASNLLVNHGFTIMALLFGILLGLLIIILIMFIIVKVCHKIPFSRSKGSDFEAQSDAMAMEGGLVTNVKMAVNKGYYSAKDVSKTLSVSNSESIVGILRQSDKFKIYRDLDNRDIQSTIYVDTQIEEERDKAMASATVDLLRGLQANGDVPSDVLDKCLKKFKKGINELDKNSENNFRNELGDIYDRLSNKNREKLADLLAQQQDEEDEVKEKTKDMSPEQRDEMLKLMRKTHETEKGEMTNILRLEQEEEAEKLRKEYSIRKRMGLKELQQDVIENVKKDAKLTEQQADWLLNEYFKNQSSLEKLYDDEISRQRMSLEEKLARRRALAQQTEAQEEHQTEVLNTLATQQMQAINKMKKEKVLSADEAKALIDEAHDEMMAAKSRMDSEKTQQEELLQQKLSERKRKRLEELSKKHEQDKAELDKKHKNMQTDAFVDPLLILEEQQKIISIQRQEVSAIENTLDEEHVTELLKLREQLANETQDELVESKTKLISKLEAEGMTEDQSEKILAKHKKDLQKLEEIQQEERERQQEEFKKTLAKRKKEWSSRREEEKKEQEQLREHEEEVVRKLMDNQVAMSEDERERIMQEHEKQMVKLENSLTLNKLQQKRMLEERLAKKRAQQMEKLQKKQHQETKKVTKQMDHDSDMDDEERIEQEVEMMKKHAEQRMAVMQGEKIELEDELDAVRDEMLKERAAALNEQEVALGAMLAALQMEKAREMARIEEQQKAIHDLKSNLMDDLNDKGILSDPKCQKVIEMHRRDQEKLQATLDEQRAKQEKKFQTALQKRLLEKEELLQQQQQTELDEIENEDQALRRRLQERLAQKKETLASMQEQQIRDAGADGASPAARIRRVALKHKHLVEMEQFRNRMEKEINQTLEEVRRQNDMRRIQDLQNQELQFINGLVRLGSFKMEELEDVLNMLFPLKTEEQRKQMLGTLTEGFKPRQDKKDPDQDESDGPGNDGTLYERVKSARFERAMSARQTSARSTREKQKPQGNKKKRRGTTSRQNGDDSGRRSSTRPDPVGRSSSPDYDSDDQRSHYDTRPLRRSANKKTKKKSAKRRDDDDYYEY